MALQEELEEQGNWLFKRRSYLPLIILVVGLALFIRMKLHPELFFLANTPYEIYYVMFSLLIGLLGLYIRIITVGHVPKNTSGRNTSEGQVADTINQTGMYSIVRHPLYVGNFLMWLAVAMLCGNFWFIVAFTFLYWIYYERIMFAEEQFLRKKFGERYLNWAKDVPAFIPRFKNYKKSNLPFSWKKILRQEKNGLFALFLLFCAFNVIGELVVGDTDFNYFLIIMCVLSGITYFILKILKNKTTILDQ